MKSGKAGKRDKKAFDEYKCRYGSRRILAELKDLQISVGRHGVRVLMQEAALKGIHSRAFIPKTTDGSHGKRTYANLLLNEEGSFSAYLLFLTGYKYQV